MKKTIQFGLAVVLTLGTLSMAAQSEILVWLLLGVDGQALFLRPRGYGPVPPLLAFGHADGSAGTGRSAEAARTARAGDAAGEGRSLRRDGEVQRRCLERH